MAFAALSTESLSSRLMLVSDLLTDIAGPSAFAASGPRLFPEIDVREGLADGDGLAMALHLGQHLVELVRTC